MIVGLIGAGNMGGALVRGWDTAMAGPDTVLIADADQQRARDLAKGTGGKCAKSNRELAEDADVVLLAVKPVALHPVAEEIRVQVSDRRIPVVSILAATPIELIEQAFGPGTPILRFMPNVNAEVRAATLIYASNDSLDQRIERTLLDLFGLLGDLVPIEEPLFDAATAISGCGPAFFSLVVEAMVDAGVKQGLAVRQATELATTTMAGTAALLTRREGNTVALRRQVTSPGGTTAAGLAALEHHHLRAAFAAAADAVVEHAATFHADFAKDPDD